MFDTIISLWLCSLSSTNCMMFALLIGFRKNVLASAKHFVGDGGTETGINEGNTVLSYDELERIHMAPYLDCISQGVCTIMASYNSWNGRKLHTDHFLLTEVLKNKLGFMVNLVKLLYVTFISFKRIQYFFFKHPIEHFQYCYHVNMNARGTKMRRKSII